MTVTNYKLYAIKPKATTNLCTNPSFETGTTGWGTSGTNTLAQSNTVQRRGVYSCKITYQDNSTLLYLNPHVVLTTSTHSGSIDIYIPSDYDGTDLKIDFVFVSAISVDGDVDMSIRDKWQRIACKVTPDAGNLDGYFRVYENGTAPTAGKYIYVDGAQIEEGDEASTYFDGDIKGNILADDVLEYYWSGQEHASTSVRTANTRAGGELVDLSAYCKNILLEGLGVAPVSNVSVPLTSGGETYLYSNYQSRYFTLQVVFEGSHIGDIQAKRNALWNLIKPDVTAYAQPLVLRYQGLDADGDIASDPVDIKCQYVSGLDRSPQMRFAHFADITFRVSDTALEVDGDSGMPLEFNDTLSNSDYIMVQKNNLWEEMAGVTGVVYKIAQHPITKQIFIAGNFLNAGGDAYADYIAKWNATSEEWKFALAPALNGIAYDIIFSASGDRYTGGAFTDAIGADTDYIFKDVSPVALDTGLNGTCRTIAIDSDGNIYAGGEFTLASGVANTVRIAKYTVSTDTWSPLSTGLNGTVYKIVIDKDDNLYVVGNFTDAGDSNGDYVVKWDAEEEEWVSLGTGSNAVLYTAALDNKGNLYVGGDCTTLGGVACSKWGRWNGQKWERLGSGLVGGVVRDILIKDDVIYLAGSFTIAGGIALASPGLVSYLKNGIYKPLDIQLSGTPTVYTLLLDNLNNLYIGFDTSGASAVPANTTITNSGNALTYPIITVIGPGTIYQIINTRTKRGIYFDDLRLLAGEVITLDLRPDKLMATSTLRGNITNYLLNISNLDFPILSGENNILTYIGVGTTDSNTAVTMKWKTMIHSLDGAQYE